MAKRKVNKILGQSAGYLGLGNYTTTLACLAGPSGLLTFSITKDFFLAIIVTTAVGLTFQLVTNGKPGVFFNSLFKRPHWVRAQRRYINTWSHDYAPTQAPILSYSPKAFWLCGLTYMGLTAFAREAIVPGLLLFIVPLVPWRFIESKVPFFK